MDSRAANADSRLSFWRSVREFAVPPSMIERATARRRVGDWAGACAAARVDADIHLRAVAGRHGRELAARVRADLRQLAPDLLRWHLPRIAPDGLLRPGLIVSLSRYDPERPDGGAVHLVARTPPAWADAGQRISLGLWDGSRCGSVRIPTPTGGSGSTCTATCGTRAGPASCGPGPARTGRRPMLRPPSSPKSWAGRRRQPGTRRTAGRPRRRSCSGRGASRRRRRGAARPPASPGHRGDPGRRRGAGLQQWWAGAAGAARRGDLGAARPGAAACRADRGRPAASLVASALAPERPVPTAPTAPDRAELPRLVPCRGAAADNPRPVPRRPDRGRAGPHRRRTSPLGNATPALAARDIPLSGL